LKYETEVFILKTSARNRLTGTVMSIDHGAVNDEVVILLDGSGTQLVSVVTSASVRKLGLEIGSKVVALFKAPWVILITDMEGVIFSARNQLKGTIVSVARGAVNAEARVRLDGGEVVTAIVTMESVKELGLEAGMPVTAMIKASNVILGAIKG
jgi:molybdate transport system regulatory protein